jgi:Limonene-1,2-epoxide hydrolase catalytic domain
MSHFAEDAAWDNVPMSPAKGKIRKMTHGFMKDASGFNVKILKSVHEGNVGFHSRVDTVTMKNGKKAEVPVAGMFELDNAARSRSGATTSISPRSPSKSLSQSTFSFSPARVIYGDESNILAGSSLSSYE